MKRSIAVFLSWSALLIGADQHTCARYGLTPAKHYQDIVVNGQTVCPFGYGQKSESRCKAIEKVIASYARPVTVLDWGSAEGYFSFKLAPKFPDSVFVMIEESNAHLLPLCKTNNLKNIVFLKKHMGLEELRLLGLCEHFDVVIVLNVLHHFGAKNWKSALDYVLLLGEKIIIETPPPMDEATAFLKEMNQYLKRISTKVLCKIPRWTRKHLDSLTYLIERKKDSLQRPFFGCPYSESTYTVASGYTQKYLQKKFSGKTLKSNYKPGINLVTFKQLNGVFPTQKAVIDGLSENVGMEHSDCNPDNFIIQGSTILPIDTNDPRKEYNKGTIDMDDVEELTQWLKDRQNMISHQTAAAQK